MSSLILSASAVQNAAVTCNGAGNGTATVTVTGGNLVTLIYGMMVKQQQQRAI